MKKLRKFKNFVEANAYWYKRWVARDKMAKVWRGLSRQYKFDAHMEAERVENWKDSSNFWSDRYEKESLWTVRFKNKFEDANLKQKKAWTAFYIATILYIVGILILI